MMGQRQPATYAHFVLDYSMQYEWSIDRAEVVFNSSGTTKWYELGIVPAFWTHDPKGEAPAVLPTVRPG